MFNDLKWKADVLLSMVGLRGSREKGTHQEREIFTQLVRVFDQRKNPVLRNVYIPSSNGVTEIDLLMITRVGLVVIESKEFQGTVWGDAMRKNWQQYLGGQRFDFYSPYKQNYGHVRALATLIDQPVGCFYSFIVFPNSTNLKVNQNGMYANLARARDVSAAIWACLKDKPVLWEYDYVEDLHRVLVDYSYASQGVKAAQLATVRNAKAASSSKPAGPGSHHRS